MVQLSLSRERLPVVDAVCMYRYVGHRLATGWATSTTVVPGPTRTSTNHRMLDARLLLTMMYLYRYAD
jgi:hypothetical protein